MKKIIVFAVVFFFPFYYYAQLNRDTVIVRIDTACNQFMPQRMDYGFWNKATDSAWSYVDSIRVCGNVVDGTRKHYYLIVYDLNGVKRLEGNFYDQFANGMVTHYDSKGRKSAQGVYRMKGKGKRTRSKLKGKMIYFDPTGKVRQKKK